MLSAILMSCRQSRRTQAYLEDEVVDLESLEVAWVSCFGVSPPTLGSTSRGAGTCTLVSEEASGGGGPLALTVGGERLKGRLVRHVRGRRHHLEGDRGAGERGGAGEGWRCEGGAPALAAGRT